MSNFELTNIQPFSENIYYINEKYIGKYAIKNNISYKATISIETPFLNEIILNNLHSTLNGGEKKEIEIYFNPYSTGEKSFKLIVSAPRISEILLEKKILNVETRSVNIEGKIEKKLPTSMKLGQNSEIIFLFTNKSNQTVTGINIDIKQIEA